MYSDITFIQISHFAENNNISTYQLSTEQDYLVLGIIGYYILLRATSQFK